MGFGVGSKVKRQSRHGNNLHPHASGSILPMNLASDSPRKRASANGNDRPGNRRRKEKQQGEFVTEAMLTDYRHSAHIVMYAKLVSKVCKASRQAGTDGTRVFADRKYRSLLGNFPSRIASNAENSPIRQGASPSAHPIGNSFLPSPKIRRIIVSQAKKERIFIWDL